MNAPRLTPTALLLHGWPGLASDFDEVSEGLATMRVIAPDLLGFGDAFSGPVDTGEATAESHARRVLAELDRSGISHGVVIAGYDIGSRVAQAALRLDPGRFDGAVLTPAYPGIGERATDPSHASHVWYQHFHREPIAAQLIDGDRKSVRAYLEYIWDTWSADSAPARPPHFARVIEAYSRPGAFAASIKWYQANRVYASAPAPIATPVTMLWPTLDPLFPLAWADRVSEHFPQSTVQLVESGHFVPLEAPRAFIDAIHSLIPASASDS